MVYIYIQMWTHDSHWRNGCLYKKEYEYDCHKWRSEDEAETYRLENTHSAFPKTMFKHGTTQEDMTVLIRDAIMSPTYKIKRDCCESI